MRDDSGLPLNFKSRESHHRENLRIQDIIHILKLRKKYIFLLVVIICIGTLIGHYLYVPVYVASSYVSVSSGEPSSYKEIILNGRGTESSLSEQIEQYLVYIKSDTFMLSVAEAVKFDYSNESLNFVDPRTISITHKSFWMNLFNQFSIKKMKLRTHINFKKDRFLPVSELAGRISPLLNATISDNERSISFIATSLDPYTARAIANVGAKTFIDKMSEHDSEELLEIEKFVQDKMNVTMAELKKTEREMIEYKKENTIITSNSSVASISNRLQQIESKLENARLELSENEKMISYFEDANNRYINKTVSLAKEGLQNSDEDRVQTLEKKLSKLRNQKELMQASKFDSSHWRFQELNLEIEKTASELDLVKKDKSTLNRVDEVDSETASEKINSLKEANKLLKTKITTLTNAADNLSRQISHIPQAEQKQLMYQRKVDLQYQLYATLQNKLDQLGIQRISLQKKVKIERLADLPSAQPQGNLFIKLLFSILVGLFFGIIISLVLELIDTSIKHKSDLEEVGLTFLGEIPDFDTKQIHKDIKLHISHELLLVCQNKKESLQSMAYKFVRARIEGQKNSSSEGIKVITITSAQNDEGKSITACNLAICLAQLNRHVILVDGDFRKPSVSAYFNYRGRKGIVDLFTKNISLEEVIINDTKTPGLDLLPAGMGIGSPTELVSSEKFLVLIDFLRESYDYVIIDSPPVNVIVDGAILSSMSDLPILVARYRKTTKRSLLTAHRKIAQIAPKSVHGIINGVPDLEDVLTYYSYPNALGAYTKIHPKNTEHLMTDLEEFQKKLKKKDQLAK